MMVLTLEDIKREKYPNECWVNVFPYNILGFYYSKREYCEEAAFDAIVPPFYRIHVRLK